MYLELKENKDRRMAVSFRCRYFSIYRLRHRFIDAKGEIISLLQIVFLFDLNRVNVVMVLFYQATGLVFLKIQRTTRLQFTYVLCLICDAPGHLQGMVRQFDRNNVDVLLDAIIIFHRSSLRSCV